MNKVLARRNGLQSTERRLLVRRRKCYAFCAGTGYNRERDFRQPSSMERTQTIGTTAIPIVRPLALIMIVGLALIGCASRGNGNGPDDGVVARVEDNDQQDWFCTPGESPDAWECLRGEPTTIRPPPSRAERAVEDTQATVEPEFDPFDDVPTPPAAPSTGVPSNPPGIQEGGAVEPPNPTRTGEKPQSAAESGEPGYAKLAYRPDRPTPILDLPSEFFAAQLFAVSTRQQVEDFVQRENLYNMTAAQVEHQGKLYYVLLLGVYETVETAEQAISAMPATVKTLDPWVRPIAGLQAAMRRAEALNAASAPLTVTPPPET